MKHHKILKDGFGTILVHGGEELSLDGIHPSSMPIYQASTFFFETPEEGAEVASGKKEGFLYTRIGNPTVKAFEDKIALLEEGEAAVAFSSGMAAVSAVMLELLSPGDEVVSSRHIYGGSRAFFDNILNKLGCPVRYFDPTDATMEKISSLVSSRTKLLFFESPSNPALSIIDMKIIAKVAAKYGLTSVIDNTFATPYLQRPFSFGIDCIIHSSTKYIGGHGDAIGGVVVGSRRFIGRLRQNMLLNFGACLAPFNAWLFLRGLKTLHVRMDHHCNAASDIAKFLSKHDKVEGLFYPGLTSHKGHAIAKKQMEAFGGVVSFRLSGMAACRRFMKKLRLCRIGVSLGDAETIVMNAAIMFNSGVSDSECLRRGTDPGLIRISTGLEDPADIIRDIEQALKTL